MYLEGVTLVRLTTPNSVCAQEEEVVTVNKVGRGIQVTVLEEPQPLCLPDWSESLDPCVDESGGCRMTEQPNYGTGDEGAILNGEWGRRRDM